MLKNNNTNKQKTMPPYGFSFDCQKMQFQNKSIGVDENDDSKIKTDLNGIKQQFFLLFF